MQHYYLDIQTEKEADGSHLLNQRQMLIASTFVKKVGIQDAHS